MTDTNNPDDLYVGGFQGAEQVDPSESLTGDNTSDPLDAGYSPPERESSSWRGDTAEEALEGESLDQHLREEQPEVWDADAATGDPDVENDDLEAEPRAGRLVDPDDGALADTETDAVAFDAGRAGDASSAEEAAMHVVADDREI